jgi:hypothetical protein
MNRTTIRKIAVNIDTTMKSEVHHDEVSCLLSVRKMQPKTILLESMSRRRNNNQHKY